MIRITIKAPPGAVIDMAQRSYAQRMEAAMLAGTDQVAESAMVGIRSAMRGARLGGLSNAIGAGSDKSKTGHVKRTGSGFRAGGWVHIRTRSERTRGAIEAYASGADIRPKRGRWLWIATSEIPSRVGKKRMTPELYTSSGLAQKIGPLVPIRSINGRPLLVVKDISVSAFGARGKAKSLTKTGKVKKGQRPKAMVVAFVGIPATSRSARFDPTSIANREFNRLGGLISEELVRP